MDNQGWVLLHRKLLDNPVCTKDSDHLALWIYILLKVTHKQYDSIFGGKRITLQPGQLITGRNVIVDNLKIDRSKIERILKLFVSEHQIEQQASNKNRLITVVNWKDYQKNEQQNEQQVSNKRATSEQQVSTYNNVNNIKNEKNVNTPKQVKTELLSEEARTDLEAIVTFFNRTFKKSVSSTKAFEKNYATWREIHPLEKIKKAISNGYNDSFWKDKLTLAVLFRQKNPRGEDVDYIEDLSNRTVAVDESDDSMEAQVARRKERFRKQHREMGESEERIEEQINQIFSVYEQSS